MTRIIIILVIFITLFIQPSEGFLSGLMKLGAAAAKVGAKAGKVAAKGAKSAGKSTKKGKAKGNSNPKKADTPDATKKADASKTPDADAGGAQPDIGTGLEVVSTGASLLPLAGDAAPKALETGAEEAGKQGMSTGKKVAIGAGVTAVGAVGAAAVMGTGGGENPPADGTNVPLESAAVAPNGMVPQVGAVQQPAAPVVHQPANHVVPQPAAPVVHQPANHVVPQPPLPPSTAGFAPHVPSFPSQPVNVFAPPAGFVRQSPPAFAPRGFALHSQAQFVPHTTGGYFQHPSFRAPSPPTLSRAPAFSNSYATYPHMYPMQYY